LTTFPCAKVERLDEYASTAGYFGSKFMLNFLPKFLALSSTHLSCSWHKEKSITDRICRWKKSFSEVGFSKKRKSNFQEIR
jgi:hypothetical protein